MLIFISLCFNFTHFAVLIKILLTNWHCNVSPYIIMLLSIGCLAFDFGFTGIITENFTHKDMSVCNALGGYFVRYTCSIQYSTLAINVQFLLALCH